MMKRVCVFCGSSVGAKAIYADAAREMGRLIASKRIGLVYGGGNVGLLVGMHSLGVAFDNFHFAVLFFIHVSRRQWHL